MKDEYRPRRTAHRSFLVAAMAVGAGLSALPTECGGARTSAKIATTSIAHRSLTQGAN
jgi:hypothetical protein